MKHLKRIAFAALMALPVVALAAEDSAKLYKNPNCVCCDEYADYLKDNGLDVEVISVDDLREVKAEKKIPRELAGCHTMVVGPYVFEGLIPFDSVDKVLTDKPFVRGLSTPGMPLGAPGMPGAKTKPIKVYELGFRADAPTDKVYATH